MKGVSLWHTVTTHPARRPLSLKPLEKAVDSLRRLIQEGGLAAGEPLPGEWELANKVGATRGTLRNALAVLSREGVIRELESPVGRVVQRVVSPSLGTGLTARTLVLLTTLNSVPLDPQREYGGHSENAIDAAIGPAAHAAGLHFMAATAKAFGETDLKELIATRPAGVLATESFLAMSDSERVIQRLADAGIRTVVYGCRPIAARVDRVRSDHAAGAEWVTNFLVERGCRRIVPVGQGSSDMPWVQERLLGYARAMAAHGLQVLPIETTPLPFEAEPVEYNFRTRVKFVTGFIAPLVLGPEAVDGIMALNDWDASCIAMAVRILGKVPNRDVLITGYDDLWNTAERQWEPARPLATVNKQNILIGQEMVRLLLDRIYGRLPPAPQVLQVAVKPVVVPQ